jgi:hypothetical protein
VCYIRGECSVSFRGLLSLLYGVLAQAHGVEIRPCVGHHSLNLTIVEVYGCKTSSVRLSSSRQHRMSAYVSHSDITISQAHGIGVEDYVHQCVHRFNGILMGRLFYF